MFSFPPCRSVGPKAVLNYEYFVETDYVMISNSWILRNEKKNRFINKMWYYLGNLQMRWFEAYYFDEIK